MAYKEKDTKKWTAQWFETTAKGEKKKRRKRGFETKREALEFERQKKLNSVKSMDMKLREFIEVYFEDKQNELKERTIKNKRYMMEQHIIPYFGDCMMSEVTAHHIIQWQNEIQTKGFSDQQPKQLYKGKYQKGMNNNDRTIYMLIYNRFLLSVKNGMVDKDGFVYIFFDERSLAMEAAVSDKTVKNCIKRLREIGLIDVVHQGV